MHVSKIENLFFHISFLRKSLEDILEKNEVNQGGRGEIQEKKMYQIRKSVKGNPRMTLIVLVQGMKM